MMHRDVDGGHPSDRVSDESRSVSEPPSRPPGQGGLLDEQRPPVLRVSNSPWPTATALTGAHPRAASGKSQAFLAISSDESSSRPGAGSSRQQGNSTSEF